MGSVKKRWLSVGSVFQSHWQYYPSTGAGPGRQAGARVRELRVGAPTLLRGRTHLDQCRVIVKL